MNHLQTPSLDDYRAKPGITFGVSALLVALLISLALWAAAIGAVLLVWTWLT